MFYSIFIDYIIGHVFYETELFFSASSDGLLEKNLSDNFFTFLSDKILELVDLKNESFWFIVSSIFISRIFVFILRDLSPKFIPHFSKKKR